jgi:hypothetical protein
MRRARIIFGSALALLLSWMVQPAGAGKRVDVKLILAVDVSGSIDAEEYQMQHEGYAGAFDSTAVLEAIQSGENQAIAVTFVEWSGFGHQKQMVGWTLIKDEESAKAFASAIKRVPRAFSDWTSISDAIDFSVALMGDDEYEADRLVIDVSGDGVNNNGRPVTAARDDAVAKNIVINGLPILNEDPTLDTYYNDNVIGGPGAFKVAVKDFTTFGQAIMSKLVQEIADNRSTWRPFAVALLD